MKTVIAIVMSLFLMVALGMAGCGEDHGYRVRGDRDHYDRHDSDRHEDRDSDRHEDRGKDSGHDRDEHGDR
jgi:Ni/Co efflux regulator RcnB